MMGHQPPVQTQLFYAGFNLESRIRRDHPLRKIAALVDFEFAYQEVADKYGINGNVSVPPPVILKLMLLLVFYNVRSERELMVTLSERLDWLWFLGFDLDSEIPNHSVLSKARVRWGLEMFKRFFERIVWQCVEAGLVDGTKLFVDSSLIEADAARSSVVDRQGLKWQLDKRYEEFEQRLSELAQDLPEKGREVNRRYVSTTDPEAALRRQGSGTELVYKTHRAVDPRAEVITAAEISRGDVHDAHRLSALMQAHRHNTERSARTVVGDSHYGTIDNYLACHEQAVDAHLRELRLAALPRHNAHPIFPDTMFDYDAASDSFRCPAGQRLSPKSRHPDKGSVDYAAAPKVCKACALRAQCTRSKRGARTVQRHERQNQLEVMREAAASPQAKRDLRLRQTLMERSFARGTRFGFDRARWRGLWRVAIQEYLVAGIQNIEVLIRYGSSSRRRTAVAVPEIKIGRKILRVLGAHWRSLAASRFTACLIPHRVAHISAR